VTLLAQKIVERNSKTGEHYIAQNIQEYFAMFKSAIGGGVITAFTVYIKNLISFLPFTRFIIGSLASINYSCSFLLIQFAGFTLGTKQPAATATSLAQKLETLEKIEQIEKVTDEITMVSRTQFIAVIGNIIAVIPTVYLINFIYHSVTHNWILDIHSAEHNLRSTDLFGPVILYAIFTGFLLWLSSVASGWTENWYAFNKLTYLLSNNKKLKIILGKMGAKRFSHFLENNISAIGSNLSLGLLLGLAPEILAFKPA
jgi:site-specific recombinase